MSKIQTKVQRLYSPNEADEQEKETAKRFLEDEKVTIFITHDAERDEYIDDQSVRAFSINGLNFYVPTGVMAQVPACIADIYGQNEEQRRRVNPVGGKDYTQQVNINL